MPEILVTGATGFVGKALARRLLRSGHGARVRWLVRDRARARDAGLPLERVSVGDLTDPESLRGAVREVAAVIHLAGAVKSPHPSGYYAANERGTRNLVEALAAAAPGARLVHVSSLAACGPSPDGRASTLPPEHARPCSIYGDSKRRAEFAVAEAGCALRWLVLRPGIVYGPGDPATRLLVRQALAPVTLVPWRPRPLSLVHVEDLVTALLMALDADVHGRFVPIEGPDRLDTHSLPRALAAACGRRARLLPIPIDLAWPVAWTADLLARWRGRASIFSSDKLREIRAAGWVCDPRPARDLLGFEPRIPTAEGFATIVPE